MKIFKARQMYLLFIVILSAFSITGCGGGGGDGQAPVLGSGDAVIVPMVTAVAPLNNATGIAINTKLITAAFSKAMAPASLTTTSFTLAQGGTAVAGGTTAYVTTGNVATLTLPAADLLASTLYTATITTAATDTAGTPLASNYVWTFTTGATADTAAPFVVATGVYGATGVTAGAVGLPINRVGTVTFNEAMNPLSITTPPSFTVVNTTLGGIPVPGTVTYSVAGKTATFTPTGGTFATNTLFTSTVTVAAKDLAGNAIAAPYVWTWSTGATPDATAPTVTTTNPLDVAVGVCVNKTVNATFSEEMDPTTITNLTFTVAGKTGLITYDPITSIASYNPDTDFAANTLFTATIKSGAGGVKDLAGNALAVDKVWSFTTGTGTCAAPVVLGSASTFAIASTSGMTTNGAPANPIINGDVVLHPTSTCDAVAVDAAGGIGPCDGTPPTVTGTVYSGNFLPAVALAAKNDLRQAYLDITPANLPGATAIAAGTTLGAPIGNPLVEGDNLFYPGVYQSLTSILITGDLTLDAQGDANAVFVFQSSSTVGTDVGAHIILAGGAKASNVWWQASSAATLQTSTIWNGNILASDNVTVNAGTNSCGRLFSGASTDGFLAILNNTVISVPGIDPAAPLCQ